MTKVKEYNGVDIYISDSGEFYCNAENNSSDYRLKMFTSPKLLSLQKAIDTYKAPKIADGEEYYDITWSGNVEKLQVISRVGNRVFFSDGSDSSAYNRSKLFPVSVEQYPSFKKILQNSEKLQELNRQIRELHKECGTLSEENRLLTNSLNRVTV